MERHDLGLIVPLEEEFAYVLAELDPTGERRIQGTLYHQFRFRDSGVTGVLSVIYGMGQPNAALATHEMLAHFDVPVVAVVGTAAALSNEVALGDVVLAQEIQSYLHAGKIVDAPAADGGWRLRFAGTSWKPSYPLCSYLHDYKHSAAGRERVRTWAKGGLAECRIAGDARPARAPRYHVAPVATGDVVVASAAFRDELLAHNRKLAALEMEAGGAALSGYHRANAVDVLVARGVSDRAGDDKAATDGVVDVDGNPNAWRAYAVRNAVNLVKLLVGAPDFPCRHASRGPAPKTTLRTVAMTAALVTPPAMLAGIGLAGRIEGSPDSGPPDEQPEDEWREDAAEADSVDQNDDACEVDFP